MLFDCHPKISHKHCFQFLWSHFNSQEKLTTILMQNLGVTNKEHYGMLWYFLEWSIRCVSFVLQWPYSVFCDLITRAESMEACKQSVCFSMVAHVVSMFIMVRWLPMRPKLLYNERKKRLVRKPLRPRPSRTMLREIWMRPFQHWCGIIHHIFIISLIRLQNSRFFKAPAWEFCANERVRRKKRKTFRVSFQTHSLF